MREKLIIKHGHGNLSLKKSSKFELLGQKKFNPVWDCSQPMSIPPHVPKHKRKRFRNLVFQKINSIALDWKRESGGCVDVRFLGEGFGVVFVMHMRRAWALICDNAKSLFGWFYLSLKNHGLKRWGGLPSTLDYGCNKSCTFSCFFF